MPDEQKASPGGAPLVPDELAEKLRLAADHAERASDVQIRLSIEGGQAEERYRYRFEATGSGALACELYCRMTQRDGRIAGERIEREDFARLIRSVDVPALLSNRRPLRQIPPCSLVGRLEITDGLRQVAFLFMADPGQAESAGYELPPELARVVEDVYSVSAKYMEKQGITSVRP
ncbi:MAG: hypothetical protein GEU99_17710 [Luteitalea sp.]|nr:hypothetical protein [Luteitalea sp.]